MCVLTFLAGGDGYCVLLQGPKAASFEDSRCFSDLLSMLWIHIE